MIFISEKEIICITPKGYSYAGKVDGRHKVIDQMTGEILDADNMVMPYFTQYLTPQQKQEIQAKKEAAERQELKRQQEKELGYFYFIRSTEPYIDITPATMVKLMLLGTYMRYNDTLLMRNERTALKKEDLAGILGISKATFWRFWKEVSGKYLDEDENGIHMIKKYFWRGRFKKIKKVDGLHSWQRAYASAIRELYAKTPTSKQAHLGRIFQILPFINFEYNIICHNPYETDLELIQPMTIDEFCDAIGYDKQQRARLIRDYSKITFQVGNHQENFLSFVLNGAELSTVKIFVNPRVMYRGSQDWKTVAILGAFCKPTTIS